MLVAPPTGGDSVPVLFVGVQVLACELANHLVRPTFREEVHDDGDHHEQNHCVDGQDDEACESVHVCLSVSGTSVSP